MTLPVEAPVERDASGAQLVDLLQIVLAPPELLVQEQDVLALLGGDVPKKKRRVSFRKLFAKLV